MTSSVLGLLGYKYTIIKHKNAITAYYKEIEILKKKMI